MARFLLTKKRSIIILFASACTANAPAETPVRDPSIDSVAVIIVPAQFVLRSVNSKPFGANIPERPCPEVLDSRLLFTEPLGETGSVKLRHVVQRLRPTVVAAPVYDTVVVQDTALYQRNRNALSLLLSGNRRETFTFDSGGSRLLSSSTNLYCYPGRTGATTLQAQVLTYRLEDSAVLW